MLKIIMIIKVMTYNLHKGKNILGQPYDMDRLKILLDKESCDIGFFQEVLGSHELDKNIISQSELLIDEKWKQYTFIKNSIVKNLQCGNSIVSKYPCLEMKTINLTLNRFEKRNALLSLVDFGKFKIHCICTHLNLRRSERLMQAKMPLTFIKENEIEGLPIIMAGDFNDRNGEVSDLMIKEGGFSVLGNESSLLTFPSILPILNLDRIFSKNLKIIENKVGASKKYYEKF